MLEDVVDHPDAVELVAVDRRGEPVDRPRLAPAGDEDRDQDVRGEAVGDDLDIDSGDLSGRQLVDVEVGRAVNCPAVGHGASTLVIGEPPGRMRASWVGWW